jgi:succinate-acetate transporter protein
MPDQSADGVQPVVVLRPMGLGAPLGYIGLACGAGVIAALQLGWIAATEQNSVAVALLAFVVPLQAVAAISALQSRDTQMATEFAVLAGSWAVIGVEYLRAPAGSVSDGMGVLLLVAGLGVLNVLAVAAQTRLVPALVIALAAARLFTDAVYQLTGSGGWQDVAGIVALALGACALYASLAIQLEEGKGRPVLPIGRRGPGAEALHGSFADQLEGIAHSPGVRKRL